MRDGVIVVDQAQDSVGAMAAAAAARAAEALATGGPA